MTGKFSRALVFGASGITGWAILQEALRYPQPNTFDRVIGLTRRPLTKSEASLPDDERLVLHSGIDLTSEPNSLVERLKKIDGIDKVTHVYFAAYVQPEGASDISGFAELKKANVDLLDNAVKAVEKLCPQLSFWTLQTGGKSYGFVHVLQIGLPKVPCKESDPRIPEPYADEVFYYAQYDLLKRLSYGKKWTFAEIRPDAIVGFVPNNNVMNLAQALGLFLAFYASREGPGATVQFPGNDVVYNALHTDVAQTTVARMHIYASLHPDATSEQVFNVGDAPGGTSWAVKWPALCDWFGLKGVSRDASSPTPSGEEYMRMHQQEWTAWETRNGLKRKVLEAASWDFLKVMLEMPAFDRQYDLGRAKQIGFTQSQDIIKSYIDVFEKMRAAKMIPS
ncbi:hypothetical protein F5884DRAFT_441544 [Xylogone sp. PMI_703]|nr:hypothetical protein F5884DRAFT_441544 [Xylogone sp. PMI_703]